MQKHFKYIIIAIILLLLQTTFIPFIVLDEIFLPDVLLIFIVLIALKFGQIEATIYGFGVGLMQDLLTIKFFGLLALSKTIAGFIIGYFYNENMFHHTIGSYKFILLVALTSSIQCIIYFLIYFQGVEANMFYLIIERMFGNTLYTSVISLLPMFYFSHKNNTSIFE